MNNPNRDDKPIDLKNIGQSKIPVEDNIGKIAPTASPYYFANQGDANIQIARPMNLGIVIGEPVYDPEQNRIKETEIEPFIPITPNPGRAQLKSALKNSTTPSIPLDPRTG